MVWAHFPRRCRAPLVLSASFVLMALPALAHEVPQAQFERGYFLQTHERDYVGAAAAFKEVVANADAPEPRRAEARRRLAQCEEEAVASDFARLMPPNALAYVEIDRPGTHVERVLKMLGLVRQPGAPAADPQSKGIPIGEGFFLPDDFSISPALIDELKKLKGLAVAVTSVDQWGKPSGVLVLHPGDLNVLRGEIETAVQFLQPDAPIEGHKTYQLQGEVWITLTSRLVIVSDSREGVAAAVDRLKDAGTESLASLDDFKRCQPARENALLFVYVSGPQTMRAFGSMLHGQEAAVARTALDLDHLETFTASVRTTDNSIQAEARFNLSPGHNNLVYALIQTAPLSGRSLGYVPEGVAAVALLGLNPATDQPEGGAGPARSFAIMDLGREIFGNMEEAALFVMPPEAGGARGGPPIPEIGLVIAAKDAAKSEMVWNQLLSLPALFGAPGAPAAREATIEGQAAKVYAFPDAPPVALVRLGDRVLVAGTQSAVAAAVRADATKQGIRQDASFKPLLDGLEPTTSKAVLLDLARVAQAAGAVVGGGEAEEVRMAASFLEGLKVSAVTEEGPTHFAVRIEATGLPNVPKLVRALAPVMMGHERAARARALRAAEETLRERLQQQQARREALSAPGTSEAPSDPPVATP